jgi:hypothetical protein
VQAELEAVLRRGFTTTHAGGFFLIPYLQQLDLYGPLGQLSAPKTTGIPTEKVALQLIWEPIFGYRQGIRSIDPISQADFGALSGLPFICSVSTEYRFLAESTTERSEAFQKHLGQRLLALGYVAGDVLNMDGHAIKLFSRKEMKASFLSKDKAYGKAIRTFYTQDQATKKPLFAKVAYSGTTVAQVTPQLVEANKEILGGPFLSVNDKEWFIGSLLEQLDKIHGIQVLLPLKRSAKRIKEMEAIPFAQFKYRHQNRPIAALVTDLDGFSGQMKLFVKQKQDGTFFALITNKKYFRASRAMEIYRRRWRIGVSRQGPIIQSVKVRPGLKDSGLVAGEVPWRESKMVKPSDKLFRKEMMQGFRPQRTVNADVASLHAIPVAETVDNVRRQQGSAETSLILRLSPAGYQRWHVAKDYVSTGEALGVRRRNLAEAAAPITVSGKWGRRCQGGGLGRSTVDRCAAKRTGRKGPRPVKDPWFSREAGAR